MLFSTAVPWVILHFSFQYIIFQGQQGLLAQIVTCSKDAMPTKSIDEELERESLHQPLESSSNRSDIEIDENDPERETHL